MIKSSVMIGTIIYQITCPGTTIKPPMEMICAPTGNSDRLHCVNNVPRECRKIDKNLFCGSEFYDLEDKCTWEKIEVENK